MRTCTEEATPELRWPTTLSRVLAYSVPAWLLPLQSAHAEDGGFLSPLTLLKLGIDLGVIAFSVGMIIACLRAIKRARAREATAAAEAERLALGENTLETVLAAEPQTLLTLGESGKPELLVSNLPGAFGVPRDAVVCHVDQATIVSFYSKPDVKLHGFVGKYSQPIGTRCSQDALYRRPFCPSTFAQIVDQQRIVDKLGRLKRRAHRH